MRTLYRKYRPLKLADVVGQEQVTEPLQKSLAAGKVGHAYLFVGPRGCGKTSVARILAHEINGFKYELEDSYVDIIEIDGASNRGIDDIRELREKATIAPTTGKYKVYIVDEVHMLTPQAFNALLKTLEEPPSHVVFILATTDAHKVPVTITSRTQVFTFKLSGKDAMAKYLKIIADQEKIAIDDDALAVIAAQGGGSFRDSLSLLDQISTLSDKKITKEMVVAAMGLPDDEKIDGLLAQYKAGDLAGITNALKDLLLSGVKPETLTEEIIRKIVESPEPELLPLLAKLADVKAPHVEARLLVALTSNLARVPTMSGAPAMSVAPTTSSAASLAQNNVDPSALKQSTPAQSPKPAPEPTAQVAFDWQGFLNKVQDLNDAIYSQLLKCEHKFDGVNLELYPKRKIVKTILSRDNNRNILSQAAPGVKITIHEVGEQPGAEEKDPTIDKISAIMGGRVQSDLGGNPFE